jgi:scyllo-inositol 2-dehydrogenase (NADP+)
MINAGVVGYGYAGRSFHAYLIGLAEGLNLAAISTRNPERLRLAAQDYPQARLYPNIDDLLADETVQLVVIATPHDTHRDLAIKAMEAGKHVVTDKIMGMTAAEADDMIQVSRRNEVMLSIFHNRRWDWDYLTVKKVITDGLLGEPYYYAAAIMVYRQPRGWRSNQAASGGILFDWPAHFVDQALQLLPAEVESVYCTIKQRDTWNIDIGNYAKLLLNFSNGALYEIEISNLAGVGKPRWYVLGERGGLIKYGLDPQEIPMVAGDIDAAQEDPAQRAKVWTTVNGQEEELVIDSVRGSWKSYYQNISDVLNQGAELIVKPEQIYRLMQVYDAARQSAATGEVVRLTKGGLS